LAGDKSVAVRGDWLRTATAGDGPAVWGDPAADRSALFDRATLTGSLTLSDTLKNRSMRSWESARRRHLLAPARIPRVAWTSTTAEL